MINPDAYIMAAGSFIKANPLTMAVIWGLLKLIAKRTETVEDDKILTLVGSWIGVKF